MQMSRSIPALTLLIGLLNAHLTQAQSKEPPKPAGATSASAGEPVTAEEAKKRQEWNLSMLSKEAPRRGCFTAAYPDSEWREVACAPAHDVPMVPRNGPRPFTVGNNNDVSAGAPSGFISRAIGHFDNVTNVTSESGPIGNSGPSIANAYTLQINTDFFNSSVCAASPNPGCRGWQQFVYENDGSSGAAYIQYWIIAYNATCPSGQSWNQIALYGGTYCWKNNSGGVVAVPNQPITNMANWTLTGAVSSTGDSVTMSTGTNVYTRTGDNAVDAANGWTIAEFNIFGDGGNSSGGGTASFNAGASAVARTRILYGGSSAPICVAQGFTAEMNNLSFGPTAPVATQPGPAVIFTESTAGGATSNCAAASTIGDTHLRTFDGLFYDFQATGDFVLAEIDPGFRVETRQVSGAPTWPDASVNKAVAARIGGSEVTICLAQGGAPRVFVDGASTAVDDGEILELPGSAGLGRRGNVFQLTSQEGNSVRATIHPTWIDVAVGLGRWPSSVKGLIANVKGNIDQIATRDGSVLTNPFGFDDLYHRFADSWRVPAEHSMLSPCDKRGIEPRAPSRRFYAEDLAANVREKARNVCIEAGVHAGALLDACTLDVAVIGHDAAAQVYVEAVEPAKLGVVLGGVATRGGPLARWWWLLLLLLLLILFVWWWLRRKT